MANRKMYIISGGMIMCDLSNMVCMPVMGNARQHEVSSIWAQSPVSCMLIENDEGLILFDTGCHPEAMSGRWNIENCLRTPVTIGPQEGVLAALHMLGYQPSDVRYIVLSHLHEDHAGCLEFFPEAEVFVSDRELTQTMRLYALGGDMGGYIRGDIREWLQQGVKWRLVDDALQEEELAEGVRILNFGPGHAFGMMGLLVSLRQSGNFILASDCVNTSRNYGPPIQFPGLAYDTIGYRKTVERLHRLEKQYSAKVLFGHDIDQYRTLKLVPEYYE